MTSRRLMIAGAALAASIAIVGTPAHACDGRAGRDCPKASDQASAAAQKKSAAKAHQTRRKSAAANVSDRRKRQARRSRHTRVAKTVPRAAPVAQAHQQTSAATRRFREFVNPKPIAANPIDELRKPRADSTELTATILFPSLAAELHTQSPVTAAPEQVASQDEINEIDLAAVSAPERHQLASTDLAPRSAQAARPDVTSDAVKSVTSATADHASTGLTWVQLIFVAWGGILTIASALRLFLG